MSEELGKLIGYQFVLSPKKGHKFQMGSVMVHDFEVAYCEGNYIGNNQGKTIITYVVNKS